MKKSRDAINIYHDHAGSSKDESIVIPATSTDEKEPATSDGALENSQTDQTPIKLTSMGAVQLTPPSANATTNAILSLKTNPFYHDKRKWDDSFTVAEKKELLGNIVKAAKDNDGETYVTLQEEEYTLPPLSHEEEESQESDDIDSANKKPGRKPMADEEALSDSDQDPKVKRKAQNRAAQRAFRERKERYVKELEAKIKQVQDAHLVATAQLVRENHQLRSIIYRLEAENYALKGIPMQPYQHQTTLSPQQPQVQPQQQQQRQNGSSNYTNIAPLLPQQNPQQPLLLPAYLSNSPNSSPASSLIHSTSSSVNHMIMLAQSPLQQYPMSPVVTTSMTSSTLNSSPSPTLSNNGQKIAMPISKKVSSKKNNAPTPPPNNQPLEYTFSISTPASLRPSGGSVSSSKHTRTEPVELVQLYPPGGNRSQQNNKNITKNDSTNTANSSATSASSPLQKSDLVLLSPGNNYSKKAHSVTSVSSQGSSAKPNTPPAPRHIADDESSIMSDKTTSTVNTQQQRKRMQQLESDMFDCHIDTEGQLFCEKLHSEVCNDAFDRLLSEPLFDQMGKLNLSISSYPVPIVTGHHMPLSLDEEKEASEETSSDDEERKENVKPAIAAEREEASKKSATRENGTTEEAPTSPSTVNTNGNEKKRLLTCPEIWFLLNQHAKFSNFTTDQLCQAVKELAKCADSGPVLEEDDLYQIMSNMDRGYL